MLELADEEPDAAHLVAAAQRPDDATIPSWAGTLWSAWHLLRYDRQYGALGGESRIPFSAIDAYARRYDIRDVEFETLLAVIFAMDHAYLEYVDRKSAEEAEKNKQEQS